jgi:hypothetical protein
LLWSIAVPRRFGGVAQNASGHGSSAATQKYVPLLVSSQLAQLWNYQPRFHPILIAYLYLKPLSHLAFKRLVVPTFGDAMIWVAIRFCDMTQLTFAAERCAPIRAANRLAGLNAAASLK